MRFLLRGLPVALVLAFALAACTGPKPGGVAPKPPPPAAAAPIPPCPENIEPGGDAREAAAFEGKPVARVCVVGGTTESRRDAQHVIDSQKSEVATSERVRADLEAIMKLGTFDDASAYGLRAGEGASVVLVYAVRDRPRVAEIGFEGATVLGDDALNAKLSIQKGNPYDPAKVNVIAQGVRDEYRSRGYDSCAVSLAAEPTAPGRVRVRIKVDEGPLWHLAKLDFRGNRKLADAELRKVSELKVGQPFVQDEVDRARLLLTALYYERGFIQVGLSTEDGAPIGPGARHITFEIEEGDVHTFRALHASKLAAPFEKELLEKVVRARPKQVFVRSVVVDDVARVKDYFMRKGQRVDVTPLSQIDPNKKTVELTFEVELAQ